jgi:hypothetical protein
LYHRYACFQQKRVAKYSHERAATYGVHVGGRVDRGFFIARRNQAPRKAREEILTNPRRDWMNLRGIGQ